MGGVGRGGCVGEIISLCGPPRLEQLRRHAACCLLQSHRHTTCVKGGAGYDATGALMN